ncbi:hypothetical protein [Streptomyces sp. NPDC005969]|uniref:hypothetical protein n=1 Tax=Streptomyces sp. NPDC005969 TaxID=3156722 RepID=UPI0033D397D2
MTDTRTVTRDQLLHLADRARRGVALPAELDQLASGITELGQRLFVAATLAADERDRAYAAERRAEKAEAAIERVRAWADEDLRYNDRVDLLYALDQPQQPAEDEARQLPCSLWLLSNGHVPHRWQPQPGMADVLCPGAPRKAVATQ